MNVFQIDRGIHQARISKTNAPEGAFVYELGHALMHERDVVIGDSHQITSTFVREAQSLYVRASVVVVAPPQMPLLAAWEVSAWLNDTKLISRLVRVNKRPLKLEDWRISLANSNPPPATK